MSSDLHMYCYDGDKPFTLLKWKIRVGSQLFYNSVILNYKFDGASSIDGKDPLLKYKSNIGGTIVELLAKEGDIVQPGTQLLTVQPCTHPVIMKDLCAECGTDLRALGKDNFEKLSAAATFSMVHVVPELKVSLEQAEKLGRDDEDRLLKSRKLVLLVDLDQTLIHTTNDNVLKDLPDVHHFQLYGPNSPWYHTKLRPGTQAFLEKISKFYELHICTFGARLYAHKIAQILDPDGKLFSHRILSRDECFDATSKTGNLKALFPRGDAMVCIIDDREDVWKFAPNVVHVKPYCYFVNTGDINAPPFSHNKASSNTSMDSKPSTTDENKTSDICENKKSTEISETEAVEKTAVVSNDKNSVDKTVDSKEIQNNENIVNKVISEENESNGKDDVAQNAESYLELTSKEQNDAPDKNISQSDKTKISQNDKIEISQNDKTEISQNDKTETTAYKCDPLHELAPDDYLLYLEEILVNIHKEYYKIYDKWKKAKKNYIPDLKIVVPKVKSTVLKGCNIVFSSVIPTNSPPETSRFWTLAESLGANVSLDLNADSPENRTTHVVASKPGTAKVNAAKRYEGIFIVGLDWLFCCAERWERADERLFELKRDVTALLDRNSPFEGNVENYFYDPTMGKSLKGRPRSKRPRNGEKKQSRKNKTEDQAFSERIFVEAGLSLSQEDIEDMDREIEEACSGESGKESNSSSESSSEESLSSGDYPKGWKKPRKQFDVLDEVIANVEDESSDVDTIGSVDEEMAEAVKQEFGS